MNICQGNYPFAISIIQVRNLREFEICICFNLYESIIFQKHFIMKMAYKSKTKLYHTAYKIVCFGREITGLYQVSKTEGAQELRQRFQHILGYFMIVSCTFEVKISHFLKMWGYFAEAKTCFSFTYILQKSSLFLTKHMFSQFSESRLDPFCNKPRIII